MPRPIDPYVVRKLADCIELLPTYINNPQKMPFVQKIVQRALGQIRFDREALARGHDSLAQGDEVDEQLHKSKKYRYELRGDPLQAEMYREPVTSVWLSDSDTEALKDGFEEDETGIFAILERQAALVAEWLKECRHPRDAELFRSELSFVCGEALFDPVKGVEISPGVYKLDLGTWEAEAAKPLCDYLRGLADEMDAAPPPPPLPPKPSWDRIKGVLRFNGEAIKEIRRIGVAKNVVLVLDSFQELDWPVRVDSPLSPDSQKHHDTIRSLNDGLTKIRFRSDGEGRGFIWQLHDNSMTTP